MTYQDYLRNKGLKPLPPPHTAKRPGDLILTGSGWVRVELATPDASAR